LILFGGRSLDGQQTLHVVEHATRTRSVDASQRIVAGRLLEVGSINLGALARLPTAQRKPDALEAGHYG